MTAKEIIEKGHNLKVFQQRRVADSYAEIVVNSGEIMKWHELFTGVFGPASSPAGVDASPEDMQLTREFGGISEEQTLYKKDFGSGYVIAMLWPWQNGEHITIKVICVKVNAC